MKSLKRFQTHLSSKKAQKTRFKPSKTPQKMRFLPHFLQKMVKNMQFSPKKHGKNERF